MITIIQILSSAIFASLREKKNLLNKQPLNRSDKDIKVGTFLWQFFDHFVLIFITPPCVSYQCTSAVRMLAVPSCTVAIPLSFLYLAEPYCLRMRIILWILPSTAIISTFFIVPRISKYIYVFLLIFITSDTGLPAPVQPVR